MKYLFLVLFLATNAFAKLPAWMPSSNIDGVGPKTAYADKTACEKKTGEACWDVSKCSELECKIKSVEVNDYSRPIYSARLKELACSGQKDCETKIKPVCTGSGLGKVCVSYCEEHEGYGVFVTPAKDKVYCAKLLGYEKKMEDQLLVDAAKKGASDAAKAQAAADAATKATKQGARVTKLKKCVADLKKNPVVQKDIEDCLLLVVKELMKNELNANEL